MRKVWKFFVLSVLATLMVPFQNCGTLKLSVLDYGKRHNESSGGNGDSYDGKIVFVYFEPGFTCEGQQAPKKVLRRTTDGTWQVIENTATKCGDSVTTTASVNFDNQSNYLQFDGHIFIQLTNTSLVSNSPQETPTLVGTNLDTVTNRINPKTAVDTLFVMKDGTVTSFDILSNDTNVNSGTLVLESVTTPGNGTTAIVSPRSISYSPNLNFYGGDSFEYLVRDGKEGMAVGVVKINVVSNFTWIGKVNALWNEPGNWCGGVSTDNLDCLGGSSLPSSSDVAVLDGSCASSPSAITCDVSVNSNLNINGIQLLTAYSGTLTQMNNRQITLGTTGFIQQNGNFIGGNLGVILNDGAKLDVTGGTFISTSGTLRFYSGQFHITEAATFQHNNGTIYEEIMATTPSSFNFAMHRLNHLKIFGSPSSSTVLNIIGKMIVDGDLTLGCSTVDWSNNSSGSIEANSDVYLVNKGLGLNVNLAIAGSSNQSLVSTGTGPNLPNFEIKSTGGIITFDGTFDTIRNWIYTSGNLDFSLSHVRFEAINATTRALNPGNLIFNDVTFRGSGGKFVIDNPLQVAGTTNLEADGSIWSKFSSYRNY